MRLSNFKSSNYEFETFYFVYYILFILLFLSMNFLVIFKILKESHNKYYNSFIYNGNK